MTSTLAGVVLMTRHGDRQGFYQNSATYAATGTTITPLGELRPVCPTPFELAADHQSPPPSGSLQHYNSGQALQKRYASNDSAPTDIAGLSWPAVSLTETVVLADASEGQVIVDSAQAFMQGFFPPNKDAVMTLADGSTVQAPFGGWVYVPVETVEADESFIFEAYTECPAFTRRTKAVYQTPDFLALAEQAKPFLDSLKPIVGGRDTSLASMWNTFDYMNVNYIHNASFYESVDIETMRHARALANDHEHRVFSDPDLGNLGNIAGAALLPTIIVRPAVALG
jgi:prostatic aicd phosphatase